MAYITAEARRELLDTVAEATGEIGAALAALGEAYEALDEHSADTLEEELFRPVQSAYGRARKTHDGFAARHGFSPLAATAPQPPGRAVAAGDLKGLVEAAVDAVGQAEDILVELQDSMSPVEVGDAELRAGLADVRGALAVIAQRAERFVSRFGR